MSDFRRRTICLLGSLLCVALGSARNDAAEFPPFESGERLAYRLLWPSGIPLGDAVFEVSRQGEELHFDVTLDARLPQYRVSYHFSSVATREGLCSLRYRQTMKDGPRSAEETIEFDQAAHRAQRTGGRQPGSAEIPECARDPLTFIYYTRSQLAAGQPAGSGSVHLGRNITVQLAASGAETVSVLGKPRPAEKLQVSIPRGNSERIVEVWFAPDATRTPLRITVPTTLAEFRAELE
ncbi:MAG: DUF3108 domain-containing protein [Terriglobia bacterium]